MKAIILSLITITACLLLVGCSGSGNSGGSSSAEALLNTTADGDGSDGGGDGNNGGGGGNGNGSNGDGGGERPSLPAEVELSISPFIDGLRIQWHNLSAIEGAGGIYIHLNLTGGNPPQPDERKIAIKDFSDDSYEIDGLDNGTAYRLVGVRVEQANNTFWVIDNITWSEPWEAKTNALDNNGNGIVVGANHDGDGRADGVDEDDDNDGRPNSMDDCRLGEIDWLSADSTLDYDSDGCRNDEDPDGDNDGINNTRADGTVWDLCSAREMGELHWQSNSTSDHDRDGCRDEGEDRDDDNDGVDDSEDSCPTGLTDWGDDATNDMDGDGCHDRDEDVDDDGDGLIEIGMAKELDAVRFVLNGTGRKLSVDDDLNTTGCGDGEDIKQCSGYELVRDISLVDYIARTNPIKGWLPIASDKDTSNTFCDGDRFTGTFNGNGFEVRGLFINRSTEDCTGLFGRATGTILNLGVIADRVIGRLAVGSLVGDSRDAKIIHSYAVSGEVRGVHHVGVGGLVGDGRVSTIIRSYAVSGQVSGGSNVGGLVGHSQNSKIVQSYAVSGLINVQVSIVGGLLGDGRDAESIHSYAVSGQVSGGSNVGGLVGDGDSTRNSYWDTETSGITSDGATGSSGETTSALRSPTDYGDEGIYSSWDDGAGVEGINDNTTIWCDEDLSGMIETDERRDNNRVWDFGTATDYPALRCTGDSLADQRAWWYLNITTHKPQLNQTRLDAYLEGTLP